mgnify:CR=1 FL=1
MSSERALKIAPPVSPSPEPAPEPVLADLARLTDPDPCAYWGDPGSLYSFYARSGTKE